MMGQERKAENGTAKIWLSLREAKGERSGKEARRAQKRRKAASCQIKMLRLKTEKNVLVLIVLVNSLLTKQLFISFLCIRKNLFPGQNEWMPYCGHTVWIFIKNIFQLSCHCQFSQHSWFMGVNNYISKKWLCEFMSCWLTLFRRGKKMMFCFYRPSTNYLTFWLYSVITHSSTCSTRKRWLLVISWMQQLFIAL